MTNMAMAVRWVTCAGCRPGMWATLGSRRAVPGEGGGAGGTRSPLAQRSPTSPAWRVGNSAETNRPFLSSLTALQRELLATLLPQRPDELS